MGGNGFTSTFRFMKGSLLGPNPSAVPKLALPNGVPACPSLRSVLRILRSCRHSLADMPWKALKPRAKVDEEENPQSSAISVMLLRGL